MIPHHDPKPEIKEQQFGESSVTQFIETPFFTVYQWKVAGRLNLKKTAPYTLVTVLAGNGNLEILNDNGLVEKSYPLNKGMHLILPNGIKAWRLEGELDIIASTPGKSVQ